MEDAEEVGVGGKNPTHLRKNFQRRTFYRNVAVDERRNPLALYYFAGKEEELRRRYREPRAEVVHSGTTTTTATTSSSSFYHRFVESQSKSSVPVQPQTAFVSVQSNADSYLPSTRSSFQDFLLGTLREMEAKEESACRDSARLSLSDGTSSEDEQNGEEVPSHAGQVFNIRSDGTLAASD
mmetsp:Transcript_304/g.997  ORF Transcript_304/g.997 Transcript_304/m.997 type:complete len:181 (-) Transcript_304:546-1088(-)